MRVIVRQGLFAMGMEKKNNLDVIRLLLALTVMLVHIGGLSQEPRLLWMNTFFSGTLAVQAFFIISGFLIIRSWEGARSIWDYAEKRARRIYPAYFAAIVLGISISVLTTNIALQHFFVSRELYRYVASNLVFLNFVQQSLPGVFVNNYINHINGSLWTLKIEVCFYVFVPLFALISRRYGRHGCLIACFGIGVAYQTLMVKWYAETNNPFFDLLGKQLPGQLPFFCAGIAASYCMERVERAKVVAPWFFSSWVKCLTSSLCVLALYYLMSDRFVFVDALFRPLFLAYIMFSLAFYCPRIRVVPEDMDISYGIYIFHFPIIQLAIYLRLFELSPFFATLLVVSVVLTVSFLSWVYIEHPILKQGAVRGAGGGMVPKIARKSVRGG